MESDPAYRHTRDDVLEVVGTQLFGLLILLLATAVYASRFAGATDEFGVGMPIPFPGFIMAALIGFGLWTSAAVATRSRANWREPRARTAIIASLLQVLIIALVAAAVGFAIAGWWIDLMTPGQSIVVWIGYGLILGSGVQGLIAVVAVAFLLTGIELPDIED